MATYRGNNFSGLSDLHRVGNHSGVDGGSGRADGSVHLVGQLKKMITLRKWKLAGVSKRWTS